MDNIRTSLVDNKQEVIVVDEQYGELTGFVCVQLKKSFCYEDYMPEITEVYVKTQHRRNGIARAMITFAEEYCKSHYPLHKFELLTGDDAPDIGMLKLCGTGVSKNAGLRRYYG